MAIKIKYPKFNKQPIKRNLHKVDVFLEDTDPSSKYFNILEDPDVIPLGKSSILIEGTEFLKKETNVIVELLDWEGVPIFTSPIPNILEGTARRIAIETNFKTAHGKATLTILGELDPSRSESFVPFKYRGHYNVRWQKTYSVDLQSFNNAPILFYPRANSLLEKYGPPINTSETKVPHLKSSGSIHDTSVTISTGNISGRRLPYGQLQPYDPSRFRAVQAVIGVPNDFRIELQDTSNPKNLARGRIYNRYFPVYFTAGGSYGFIRDISWDFDDNLSFFNVDDPDNNDPINNGNGIYSKGNISDNGNVIHVFRKAGVYNVTLTVTGLLGDISVDRYSIDIEMPLTPIANFTTSPQFPELGLELGSVTFTNTSRYITLPDDDNMTDKGYGIDTEMEWDFGDNTYTSEFNPTHNYAGELVYFPKLTIKNAWGEQWDTKQVGSAYAIEPIGELIVDFEVSKIDPDIDEVVTFTNLSTIDTPHTRAWWFTGADNQHSFTFENGSVSTDENVDVSFQTDQEYDCFLEVYYGENSEKWMPKYNYINVGGAGSPISVSGTSTPEYGEKPQVVTYTLTSTPPGAADYFIIDVRSVLGSHETGNNWSDWYETPIVTGGGGAVTTINDRWKITTTTGNAVFTINYIKADSYWVAIQGYNSGETSAESYVGNTYITDGGPTISWIGWITSGDLKVGVEAKLQVDYTVPDGNENVITSWKFWQTDTVPYGPVHVNARKLNNTNLTQTRTLVVVNAYSTTRAILTIKPRVSGILTLLKCSIKANNGQEIGIAGGPKTVLDEG